VIEKLSNIPNHVAIIMDGNGRWAKKRKMPRIYGHKKGADALRDVMNGCRDIGIKYLTIYAFSAENWQRPQDEVSGLMELLHHFLQKEIAVLHKNNIKLLIIGDKTKLPENINSEVTKAEELTKNNTDFTFIVALSYGSRQEIVSATKQIAQMVKNDELQIEEITENLIHTKLYTGNLPEPDLLIRTGGEQRISNFLLWQSAYTEFYFSDILWPDFTAKHLQTAIDDYAKRERRFGKV
jgi:undecaprenyl diphosphate synthase